MTTSSTQQSAKVIPMPTRRVDPMSPAALLQLVQRHAAWRRAHPNATVDEDLAAGAELAQELGL